MYKSSACFVSGEKRLFHKDRFNLRIIMYLSIFVTFGVIFPPLAVMICVSVFVQSYFTQLSIGRAVETTPVDSDERRQLLRHVDQDCLNVGVIFKQTVYAVGPSAAFLYSFILFDTYGDTAGGKAALWLAALMFGLGCSLSLAFKLLVMREPQSIRSVRLYSSSRGSSDNRIEMGEMARPAKVINRESRPVTASSAAAAAASASVSISALHRMGHSADEEGHDIG